jgi:hypothetical protein
MLASGISIQDFHRDWHTQPQEVDSCAPLLHVVDDVASPHAAKPRDSKPVHCAVGCVCLLRLFLRPQVWAELGLESSRSAGIRT